MSASFSVFYDHVLDRVGGEEALLDAMPILRPEAQLEALSADRYLSAMSLRVFRAGLKHSMVNARWPQFERAFSGFNPTILSQVSDDDLEVRMRSEGVIKHWAKVKSIRTNAMFVQACEAEHGSFGRWIASWPRHDITALWQALSKRGVMLGGKSGASFLRYIGKDTMLLTDDVISVLKSIGLIQGNPMTKTNLALIQGQFNDWHEQSGLPYSHISRIISMTTHRAEIDIDKKSFAL